MHDVDEVPCSQSCPDSGCAAAVIVCSVLPASPPAVGGWWGRCPEWWASWHPGPLGGSLSGSYTDASKSQNQCGLTAPHPSLEDAGCRDTVGTLLGDFRMSQSGKIWITGRTCALWCLQHQFTTYRDHNNNNKGKSFILFSYLGVTVTKS